MYLWIITPFRFFHVCEQICCDITVNSGFQKYIVVGYCKYSGYRFGFCSSTFLLTFHFPKTRAISLIRLAWQLRPVFRCFPGSIVKSRYACHHQDSVFIRFSRFYLFFKLTFFCPSPSCFVFQRRCIQNWLDLPVS